MYCHNCVEAVFYFGRSVSVRCAGIVRISHGLIGVFGLRQGMSMSTRVVSSRSVLDFSMIFASHGISRYTAPICRLFGFTGFSV